MAILDIKKLGTTNFWHYYDDNEYSASDVRIDFEGDYVQLTRSNGALIFKKEGFLYSDVGVYDVGGSEETFTSASDLEQRLIDLGYIAYTQGAQGEQGIQGIQGEAGADSPTAPNGEVVEGDGNAVSGETVYEKLGDGVGSISEQINTENVWKHPEGDSEYVGDTYYQNKGLGTYLYNESQIYFNKVSFKFGLSTSHEFNVRIYSGDTEPIGTWDLSTYNLLHEEVYASGDFETSEDNLTTINLGTDGLTVDGGKYILVLGRATDNTVFRMKRWSTGANTPTSTLLFSGNDFTAGWTEDWAISAYTMTPLLFEFKKDIETEVEAIIDARTDIPFMESGESQVAKDTDTLLTSNVKIDVNSFYHSRGDAEYIGNSTYSLGGVGLFHQVDEPTLVKVIRFKIYALATFTGTAKIYQGATENQDPTSHTLIETFTYSATEFNSDGDEFAEVVLTDNLVLAEDEFIYVYIETTNTVNPTIKRWTADSGVEPYRNRLLFLSGGTWYFGSPPNFYSTPIWLLSETDEDLTSIKTRVEDLESGKVDNITPRITIADDIYAVVGTELSLYYDSLILSQDRGLESPLNANVEIICARGEFKERCWQYTPIIGDIGVSTPFTVNVYDFNKTLLETKSVTLNVIASSAPSTVKNCLFVGDSLTANGDITEKVRDLFVLLGSNTPVFWGTQDTSPNEDEGRSGWSFATFVGATSPFYNGGVIDIANYRSGLSMGATKFDYVSIQLGINDCFDTEQSESESVAIIDDAKTLIDGFITDNSSCIITIQLPSVDSNTKGGWGANYGSDETKDGYQLNVRRLRELIISEFDDGAYDTNVKVGIAGLGIDRYYGYPRTTEVVGSRYTDTNEVHTNALHPDTEGYEQMADTIYPQMLNKL